MLYSCRLEKDSRWQPKVVWYQPPDATNGYHHQLLLMLVVKSEMLFLHLFPVPCIVVPNLLTDIYAQRTPIELTSGNH